MMMRGRRLVRAVRQGGGSGADLAPAACRVSAAFLAPCSRAHTPSYSPRVTSTSIHMAEPG
jgi:hypothetical protein